ncbi:unnamed protein product [Rotaria sp. Silwood1]|nr:unnamed protein product [Rotaria sp. Silwood1]
MPNDRSSLSNLKYTIEHHHDISNIIDILKKNNDSKFQTYIIWLSGAIACIEKENLIILSVRNHNGNLIATSCIEIFHIDFSEDFVSNKIKVFLRWLERFHIIPIFWRCQYATIWIPPFYQFSGIYYHIDINENEVNEINDIIQKYVFQIRSNILFILEIKEANQKNKNIIMNNDREFILPWYKTTIAMFPSNIDSLEKYINLICKKRRRKNLKLYKKQFKDGGGKTRYLFSSLKIDFDEMQTQDVYTIEFGNEWMSSMILTNKLLNNNHIIFIFAEENSNEHLLGFMLLFIHSSTNQIIAKAIGIHDNIHTRQLKVYQNLVLSAIDWSLINGYNVIDFGTSHEETKALLIDKDIRLCDDEHTRAMVKIILRSKNLFYKFITNQMINCIRPKDA